MIRCRNLRTKVIFFRFFGKLKWKYIASKVLLKNKKKSTPNGVLFLFGETGPDRFEKRNAARMSAAREGSTERHYKFSFYQKENC